MLHSTRCWYKHKLQEVVLHIADGKILSVHPNITEDLDGEYIDLGDAVLMPGVIDAHVHINEPGRTEWEGFESATCAAAAGGTTTVIDMPLNSSPVTITADAYAAKKAAATHQLHVNCGFWGGLVSDNLRALKSVLDAGCLGIKAFLVHSGIDEFPNVDREILDMAMPLIARYNVPLLVHCELPLEEPIAFGKDPGSYQAYLATRPRSMENDAIRMLIEMCRKHQCHTHIVHLSSADILGEIEQAKADGLPLTVETCPHYLFFDAEDIPDGRPLYKCAPPIRESANNEQLREAVKRGVIDFLATDHSPAPPAMKNLDSGDLETAWGGISGLQTLLTVSWTALKPILTLSEFIPLLTTAPTEFAGLELRKGKIAPGFDADLVAWDPDAVQILTDQDLHYRHPVSLYTGRPLQGEVKLTMVNGQIVFDGQSIIQTRCGQLIER